MEHMRSPKLPLNKPAQCHPGRAHVAHGLCRVCYNKQRSDRFRAPRPPVFNEGVLYSKEEDRKWEAKRQDDMTALERAGAAAKAAGEPPWVNPEAGQKADAWRKGYNA